jgi:hypothetical protein
MKKIYLGLSALAFSTAVFAQNNTAPLAERMLFSDAKVPAGKVTPINTQKGVSVWSDDFSSAGTWVLDNAGQTDANKGWNINTSSQAWYTANGFGAGINSTTKTNGYAEVQNGNYNTGDQVIGVVYTMTNATAIDVDALTSGANQVSLQFQQFGALFNDSQIIEVSTDGTTWTEVGSNNNRTTFVGNNPTAIYANPETVSYNISTAIASDPTNVFIRFSWTSRITGNSTPGAWTTFGWFIDDVELITNDPNNLTQNEALFGSTGFYGISLPYYSIPLTQITDVDYAAVITNNGALDQTNSIMSVDVNGGTFTATSATGFTSLVGATDTLFATTSYVPASAVGSHTAVITTSADNADDAPADNTGSTTFNITNNIYARDNGTVDGTVFNQGESYEAGNVYDIFADQMLYAVNVKVSNVSAGAPLIYGKLYMFDPVDGSRVFVDQTEDYQLTTAQMTASAEVPLVFNAPIQLTANNSYLLVVGSYGDAGATNDLVIAAAGTSEPQTSNLYDEPTTTWFYVTSTPWVRMNFDASIGIQETKIDEASLGQNFPNPSNGVTSFNYTLANNANVMIEISDLSGKVIEVINEGSKTAGTYTVQLDYSNLSAGTYFYTLSTENGKVTKSMNIIK